MPRRINYKWAAIVGAIIWVLIAMCFGGLLLAHGLTFNDPPLSQRVAMLLLLTLYVPFGFILESIDDGKPIFSLILNGALWGLVAAFVYNKISARRGQRKQRS